jgi:hypothetical protein
VTRLRDRPVRLGALIATAVVTTLISLLVGVLVERYGLFNFVGTPPTISEQLQAVRHAEAVNQRRVVASERLQLHGDGSLSYLLVFRDNALPFRATEAFPRNRPVRSDLVRIYDIHGGRLRLAFAFEPPPAAPPRYEAFAFLPRSVEDIDGDGKNEIVGSWNFWGMEPVEPAPVAISWDDARAQYSTIPLLSSPKSTYRLHGKRQVTRFLLPPSGGYAHDVRHNYLRPTVLRDRTSGTTVTAFAAEDFFITKTRFFSRVVVAAYIVKARYHADVSAVQLIPWGFNLYGTSALIVACISPPSRQHPAIVIRPRIPLTTAIAAYWRKASLGSRTFC